MTGRDSEERARELLNAGDAVAAAGLLEQAVARDPAQTSLWLLLAAARRSLRQTQAEMAAIERALALDPRNMRARLQKASLEELLGTPRAAAMSYRYALGMLPPGFEPPPHLREVLQHARDVIAANDRALEAFLDERLASLRAQHGAIPLRRFETAIATVLRKQPVYRPQPSFLYFPNLPAIEFHDRADFPWLAALEAATDDIRAELTGVLADGASVLEPYVSIAPDMPLNQWRELNRSRRWGVYYLWREGVPQSEHLARCPRTARALEAWPRCEVPGCGPTAVFSILEPKTRIPPHHGVTNTRLIVHLPLIVPPGCLFRVGGERREWLPGKAFVFDDTFEHEAWNDGDAPRAVLILDIWSPHLSAVERALLQAATGAIGAYYGTPTYQE
jgi:aspartyl/asparaginyl beta-hydroxylase (cupin superfamily)